MSGIDVEDFLGVIEVCVKMIVGWCGLDLECMRLSAISSACKWLPLTTVFLGGSKVFFVGPGMFPCSGLFGVRGPWGCI